MTLKKELLYRISLSADFLSTFQQNNKSIFEYKQGNKNYDCPIYIRLSVIDGLLDASEFLDRRSLYQIAANMFDDIRLKVYQNADDSFVIDNEKSFTACNAMAASITMKLNDSTSINYLQSVQKCIHGKGVYAEYPVSENNAVSIGKIVSVLFNGYEKFNRQDFFQSGMSILDSMINSPIDYDSEQMRALRYLYQKIPDLKYLKRSNRILANFKNLSNQITSLVASIKQQSFLYSNEDGISKESSDLLQYQFGLQIEPNNRFQFNPEFYGAFILHKLKPEIRVDYTTSNMLSFMEYYKSLP